jgi:cytidylate kinase
MEQPSVITIDGPAGSGKSTLGELLARRLGYLYFDTGIMYRALALAALRRSYDLADSTALETLAETLPIDILPPTVDDGRQYTVRLEDQDCTWDLRSPAVDQHVSLVARYPAVRDALIRQQRRIGRQGHIVMVGRDIGTIVMPDAGLKLYLEASLAERARRRLADQQSQGRKADLEAVQAELARRDELDSHVMQAADDALILQTDSLSPEALLDRVLLHLAQRTKEH